VNPSARTRVIALLGDPVSHSLSPHFQNAALRAAGLDGVYVAMRCTAAELPGLLTGLTGAGGAGNVTVPHKELAARTVERRTETVDATGACNTFWMEDGRVCGDNTDVEGVSAAVRALLGRTAAGARVLLLGAGGSARAVLHALASEGAERIVVLNRTPSRAEGMIARGGRARTSVSVAASADALAGEHFDLAVNTTSLGLVDSDDLPLAIGGPIGFAAALDLVYARGGTRWVREAAAHGIPAADGTEMLLMQGAASFRRWWSTEPPIEAMRSALAAVAVA
jgi:shikimate dehydrogenase